MMNGRDPIHGGVLTVGSLLWGEDDRRDAWRQNWLALDRRVAVFAPIRYGRKSPSGTHTMVLSRACSRTSRRGTAWVVPFQHSTSSEQVLRNQVMALASAEANRELVKPYRDWFSVGLRTRPASRSRTTILQWWQSVHPGLPLDHDLLSEHLPSEGPVVDREAHLRIAWPTTVGANGPCDLDYVLATPTVPTLGRRRYPAVAEIASAWTTNQEYFRKNRQVGISTVQDSQILRILAKAAESKSELSGMMPDG